MLQKSSTLAVLEVFFVEPSKEHYLMDISRKTKLAHTSVKKNLANLIKEGFIRQESQKKGKREFPVYKAMTGYKRFKQYKIISNMAALQETGIIDFLDQKLAPKVIVVFGSYRRGEDQEDSDIDLFVEGIGEKLDLSAFEKRLKRKIQVHSKRDFTAYPKELKNNIINGIVMHGFLEGYK